MATGCIIDDYVLNRRSSLLFNDSQINVVKERWSEPDILLAELQHFDTFKGKTSWDQLDPLHFRMLISTTMTARDTKLDPKDYFNDKVPLVQSLYLLLMGLVYCLHSRTGLAVDTIRVMRISDSNVSFESTITLIADRRPEALPAPPKPGLSIIVDNTQNDNLN
jgi:hypothetical protein